jgi:hypothetical protein
MGRYLWLRQLTNYGSQNTKSVRWHLPIEFLMNWVDKFLKRVSTILYCTVQIKNYTVYMFLLIFRYVT